MISKSVLIIYYTLAASSLICSSFVSYILLKYGLLKTSATKLLLCFHISLIIEEITILPDWYNSNYALCTTMEFLHICSGMSFTISVGLLVISYRYHFFEDIYGITKFIDKRGIYLIVLFPIFGILPLFLSSIGNDESDSEFCTIGTSNSIDYIIATTVFFTCSWLILLFCTAVLISTMYQVYILDEILAKKLLSTIGMYAIISIISWIPRTLIRLEHFTSSSPTDNEWIFAYIPIFISGILYMIVFLSEKKSLLLFDKSNRNNELFSWENASYSNMGLSLNLSYDNQTSLLDHESLLSASYNHNIDNNYNIKSDDNNGINYNK